MSIIEEVEYDGDDMTVVFKNTNNGAYMQIRSKNRIIKSTICGFYNNNCVKLIDTDANEFYIENFKR